MGITVARSRYLQATEWPNASTTGVPAGTSLTPVSGDQTTSSNGQTIQDLDVTAGAVVVEHNNVTVRRCRIEMDAVTAVFIAAGTTGTIVEDCELFGDNGSALSYEGNSATIRRLNVHGCENGFHVAGNNLTILDCYIHDLDPVGADPHTDGLQCSVGASQLTVEHCNFELDTGGTVSGGIQMENLNDSNNDWLVNNTRVILANGGPSSGAVTIRLPSVSTVGNNNRFTNLRLTEAEFGYVDPDPPDTIDEWSAVDDITGDPVP